MAYEFPQDKTIGEFTEEERTAFKNEAVNALKTRGLSSEQIKAVKALLSMVSETALALSSAVDENKDELKKAFKDASDYVTAELEAHPEYASVTGESAFEIVAEIFRNYTPKDNAPTAYIERLQSFIQPIDKINENIWNTVQNAPENQLAICTTDTYNIDTHPKRKDRTNPQHAIIVCSVNYDAVPEEIKKKLTAYDRRVYDAVYSLYIEANRSGIRRPVLTVSQIANAMGHISRPSSAQLKKVNDSLTKMSGIRVYIDNADEVSKLKNYPKICRDEVMLSFGRLTAIVDGSLVEGAIRIDAVPFLGEWAAERKQITTINPELHKTPLSLTEGNIRLEDYLLTQIARIKSGYRKNPKMLFETIFRETGNSTKMQRKRAKENLLTILKFYVEKNHIKGFTEEKDGIVIEY
jgi:hypothetical protein